MGGTTVYNDLDANPRRGHQIGKGTAVCYDLRLVPSRPDLHAQRTRLGNSGTKEKGLTRGAVGLGSDLIDKTRRSRREIR